MAEENIKFVDIVATKLSAFFGGKKKAAEGKSTEYQDPPGHAGFVGALKEWYYKTFASGQLRSVKYDRYKFLLENLAEAQATANTYADNIVSGDRKGEENYKVSVDSKTPNIEKIEEVVERVEKRTRIKDQVWEIAHDMNSYGDDFYEIVIGEDGKELIIDKLKQLPRKEIFANVDGRGVVIDPEYPYVQKEDFSDKKGIQLHGWRVLHFKIGHKIYGVDRALFFGAPQRIGRQLLWIDDSMVIARITRAWMRYVYNVDVSGMSSEQALDFLDVFEERTRRTEIVDRSSGRLEVTEAPPLPDEDIYMPVREGSNQGVTSLSGDMNIGNIADVYHLQNKFFMSVGMPKAYASIEEGTRAKATLTQLDVQFARQVRRKQNALKPGLRDFYKVQFYLSGIDPMSFKWDIVFPEMATMDEMIKWEMEALKAAIAKTYVVDVGALNTTWVYEELLKFSKEEIDKWATILPTPGEEGAIELSPELTAMIKRDPYTRQILDNLKDIVAWKLERERQIEGKALIGLDRETSLSDKEE